MVELIKMAAVGAVNEAKPTAIIFGTVVSKAPLEINIEQRLTLNEAQLILTNNVKDYDVSMTVQHSTEENSGHTHGYTGRKIFRIHNGLSEGEQVILLQMQGGQKYVVLDKVVNA